MKKLFLVRHAKAESPKNKVDFERELHPQGLVDAENISMALFMAGFSFDKFISSPAARTEQTAKIFAKNLNYPKNIQLQSNLYLAPILVFEEVVWSLQPELDAVIIFAHNPGISEYAYSLGTNIYEMPTSAVIGIEAQCKTWQDFNLAKKNTIWWDYPSNFD